ncbi:SDR family NAD(P)-dependent oxidoreductase [Streptomyces sp. NPDC085946]|uniref:SDR family NAD(P)-dependent oxidoreductase n=1 Tax=Streptomyces sp. NPDC085946 TaxID=3365744 RepID=UPI0037D8A01C
MDALRDKVVVITGAGRGQGLEELRKVVAEGGIPVAVDLDLGEEARSLAALSHQGDVSDAQLWTDIAGGIGREHGQLHGLVNNAGIGARTPPSWTSPPRPGGGPWT